MPRPRGKTIYVCEACGNESLRWEGRCPACAAWNTLAELPLAVSDSRSPRSRAGVPAVSAQELAQVSTDDVPRLALLSDEANRVFGGGIVPGSLTLIAGDPGIGKSTLLLRLAADISSTGPKTLYVTGEESAAQVKLRAERLKITGHNLFLLPATDLDDILSHLDRYSPALTVVDSIQTVYDDSVATEPGSVGQIKTCTRKLVDWAKTHNSPIILTGHVTKGGDIAGPRVMEHMVDVVVYMEGEPISSWRLLRTIKNRFGSTNEVGVFEMTDHGLIEVEDPSKALLSERRAGTVGSVIVSSMEGSRPLLVEVQALTSPSVLPTPRRVATGIEFNRLLLVCAVLTRRVGISLANQDIVVNVAGGLRLNEPAADLGLALAIVSSVRDTPVDPEAAAIGEVGLSGEIRMAPQLDRRIREVTRLGLKRCLIPGSAGEEPGLRSGLEAIPVRTVAEAVRCAMRHGRPRSDNGDSRTRQPGRSDTQSGSITNNTGGTSSE